MNRRQLIVWGLTAVALLQPIGRYGEIVFGTTEPNEFAGDAVYVYQPVARAVIEGSLSYGPVNMNKPPGWWLLNLLPAYLGNYWLWAAVLMGLGNGATVLASWYWLRRSGFSERVAILSVVLLTAGIAPAYGLLIGPRSLALPGIILAFTITSPTVIGVMIGLAGSFTQFTLFAIPGLLYWQHQRSDLTLSWTVVVGSVAIAVCAASFVVVALGWGIETAQTAVRYSVLNAGGYTAEYGGPVSDPIRWVLSNITHAIKLGAILVAATVGAWSTRRDSKPTALVVVAIFLLLPLFIRPGGRYWFLALPFLAVIAAMGVESVTGNGVFSPN